MSLKALEGSYKFYGFPLNFTFTNLESIWEAIEATGIHELNYDNQRFVVSVECAPYKSNVILEAEEKQFIFN